MPEFTDRSESPPIPDKPSITSPANCEFLLAEIVGKPNPNDKARTLISQITPDTIDAVISTGIKQMEQERNSPVDELFNPDLSPAEAFSTIALTSSQPHLITCCISHITDSTHFLEYLDKSQYARERISPTDMTQIRSLAERQISLNKHMLKLLVVDIKLQVARLQSNPEIGTPARARIPELLDETAAVFSTLQAQHTDNPELSAAISEHLRQTQKYNPDMDDFYERICTPIGEIIRLSAEDIYIPTVEDIVGVISPLEAPLIKRANRTLDQTR